VLLKILLINYEYPPFGGGAANATQQIALALVDAGHQVAVLTGAVGNAVNRHDGVDLIPVNSKRRRYGQSNLLEMGSFLIRACWWVLRLKQREWDVAIVFFGVPCGPIASLLKWRHGIPYIVSLRGGDVPGFEPQMTGLHTLLTPIRRLIYRSALDVVANSRSLASLSESRDPGSVRVIPNGVDTAFFRPANHNRGTSDDLRLLMSSRFHRQKRIPETLFLLNQARQAGISFKLLLVGEGPDEGRIKETISSLSMEPHVTLMGWVKKKELVSIYQSVDCFLSLSLHEGMPNSVLEAMACELPVMLSDIPSHRELVKDNITGFLVNPEDASAVVESLNLIEMNPVQATEMGKKARELAEQEFSWSATASGYLSLFNTEQ
jgi:glycosyltransferase involved in cell wall biosynthesis